MADQTNENYEAKYFPQGSEAYWTLLGVIAEHRDSVTTALERLKGLSKIDDWQPGESFKASGASNNSLYRPEPREMRKTLNKWLKDPRSTKAALRTATIQQLESDMVTMPTADQIKVAYDKVSNFDDDPPREDPPREDPPREDPK